MRAVIIASLFATLFANALKADQGELVPIKPKEVFVPVGFDSNDEIVAVVDGYLPDPCHRLRQPNVQFNKETHSYTIMPMAERFQWTCPDVIVPFTQVVALGTAKEGNYRVLSFDGGQSEALAVAKAKNPSPDDYLYAPVDNATVFGGSGGAPMQAVIQGRFTNTCEVLDQVKMNHTGKSVQVLPIMKLLDKDRLGRPCAAKERPFQTNVVLSGIDEGRHLLHVRSLDGRSVNELFTAWR